MTRIFLVGPLDDPGLLEQLLGHNPQRAKAQASGYCLSACRDGQQAALWPEDGAVADGHVVEFESDDDLRLLEYYAKGLGLNKGTVQVALPSGAEILETYTDTSAQAFVPWDVAAWRTRWAPVLRRAAVEVRDHFGNFDAAALAERMPMILARAAAFRGARADAQGDGPGPSRVDVKGHRRPYTGFFSFQEFDLSYERFDGKMGPEVTRGVLVAQDAAILLPYDPKRDAVLLVEQFRIGHFARGDAKVWSLEPVAGIIDPGETPQEAARREAMEEAGLDLDRLIPVCGSYPSPGTSSEFHHCFVGLCALPEEAAVIGGLASESEDIRGHIMPAEALFASLRTGDLDNGPLYLLAFWLELNRKSLRGNA